MGIEIGGLALDQAMDVGKGGHGLLHGLALGGGQVQLACQQASGAARMDRPPREPLAVGRETIQALLHGALCGRRQRTAGKQALKAQDFAADVDGRQALRQGVGLRGLTP